MNMFTQQIEKKNHSQSNIGIQIFLFLTAIVMISLCSRSSFLYPFNDWDDVNCYFTVGKAVFSGQVLYRDIYEQKGFLVYIIYGLAGLISKHSFFGAYLIEVFCFFVFLRLVWKMLSLFMQRFFAAALCPVLAAVICSTRCFDLGGSVEELSITILFYPIYILVSHTVLYGNCIPPRKQLILLGCGAALLFWAKFTLVGIYIGYLLFAAIYMLWRKEINRLLHSVFFFLLGFSLISLPVLFYFLFHGALSDLWTVYFYNNLFIYSAAETSLRHYLWLRVMVICQNLPMVLLIILGIVWILRAPFGKTFRCGMLSLYFGSIFFIYAAGVAYEYYACGIAPLAVVGLVECVNLFRYILGRRCMNNVASVFHEKRVASIGAALLVFIGSCVFAFSRSMNSFYMTYRAEDLWYTHFAEQILHSKDTSLINLNCLDLGLYTVTETIPTTRFFCRLNIPLQEMQDELERYIHEGTTEWVLAKAPIDANDNSFVQTAALLNERYELVMQEQSFFRVESNQNMYYLYQRRK